MCKWCAMPWKIGTPWRRLVSSFRETVEQGLLYCERASWLSEWLMRTVICWQPTVCMRSVHSAWWAEAADPSAAGTAWPTYGWAQSQKGMIEPPLNLWQMYKSVLSFKFNKYIHRHKRQSAIFFFFRKEYLSHAERCKSSKYLYYQLAFRCLYKS